MRAARDHGGGHGKRPLQLPAAAAASRSPRRCWRRAAEGSRGAVKQKNAEKGFVDRQGKVWHREMAGGCSGGPGEREMQRSTGYGGQQHARSWSGGRCRRLGLAGLPPQDALQGGGRPVSPVPCRRQGR
ncbi:hypothetical protein I4F81_001155 [Pyropia yezoensis]|uniref:Uncharacterized protein n=1 Tax=Pyropia yezoensis TaxID=2788 RepID=A0ACC3BKS2_PYRYE|nr:hypothetical protein I4F81_001155 [Neopyropia yezoensis]